MSHVVRHAIWNYFISLVFLMAFALMAYIVYLMFAIPQPIVANHQPYIIINKDHIIDPGKTVLYIIDVTKNTDTSPEISRNLICDKNCHGPAIVGLSTITTSLPPGSTPVVSGTTTLPNSFYCGTWYLALDLTYRVNPFHAPVTVHLRTEDFIVKNDCLLEGQ